MNNMLGSKIWLIPDGFIPEKSSGILKSHEAICLLNCNSKNAKVNFTVYFEDKDPIENIEITLDANRTKHVKTDSLILNGVTIPVGIPYAIKVSSNVPIIVQYSRMDSTQPANALMTTMAFNVEI